MNSMTAEARPTTATVRRRVCFLDILRGVAIVYMVFYHVIFDLAEMFGVQWARAAMDSQDGISIYFTGAFVLLGGVTIRFSRDPAAHGARLLCIAALFTLVTAVVFPGSAIYFGVLHLFSVAMLVYAVIRKVFCRVPWWLSSLLSLLLFAATCCVDRGYFGIKGLLSCEVPELLLQNNYLYPFGFITNGYSSVDYLPILPWLFLFLLGSGLGALLQRELPDRLYTDFCPPLSWLGRHSLIIYIVHQPVVFAVLYVIFQIIN